ncbi:hypothetical protein WAI453_001231 [Rhynchosporium graminicola]
MYPMPSKYLIILEDITSEDGWPSWLWRQVKVYLNNNLLVTKVAWVRVPLRSHEMPFCFLCLKADGLRPDCSNICET